jgi:vancomycin permeability regulator SanA
MIRRLIRTAIKIILAVVVLLLVYFAVTAVQVYLTSRESDPVASQAIVIMGAAQYNGSPSPDLLARLQEAYSLYQKHLATVFVATGAKEPGDTYTEAWTEANWLEHNGVPARDIYQVGGRTTWSSLNLAKPVMKTHGISRVLLVTDGFHEDRCLAIESELGITARPVPATNSPITGWSAFPYFMKETAAVGIGRVIGYSHLEWIHELS